MGVLDRFRAPILALARAVPDPDAELSALLVFQERQMADCLWLLLPGSVGDAENPLNLCAHAETATLKAILEALRPLPGETGDKTRALLSSIDVEMVQAGTSYALCVHSGETFNTASPVRPGLGALAAHLANGYTIAAIVGMVLFGTSRYLRARHLRTRRVG